MTEPGNQPLRSVTLTGADAQALDTIIESRTAAGPLKLAGLPYASNDAAPPPPPTPPSVLVSHTLKLLAQSPVAVPPEDLAQRTLQRVAQARRGQRFGRPSQAGQWQLSSFGWFEAAALAAVVVIGVSVVWPVLERTRAAARQLSCANNLAAVGNAIGSYAADFDNQMPRGHVLPGSVWWNVGQTGEPRDPVQSNSAHLYRLIRLGYAGQEILSCPDNPAAMRFLNLEAHDWPTPASVSYSYQNQHTPFAIRLDNLDEIAILADKNPLFIARPGQTQGMQFRLDLPPTAPTAFHSSLHGQNILTSTGRVLWSNEPFGPNADAIWVTRQDRDYHGTEIPTDPSDSFLVP